MSLLETGAWMTQEGVGRINGRAGPPPSPPRPHPGDSRHSLHLLLARAHLCTSRISCVHALSPPGHMLLSDSCLTAYAGGAQSFQSKCDKHTCLLSVLLWAICQCGVVPSLGWQDSELGPPRKFQEEGCHQRDPRGMEGWILGL